MDKVQAFVGHSFEDQDKEVVDQIQEYLNTIKKSLSNFDWENAKSAQPSPISLKVKEIIENKNLFIGIFTKKELAISESKLVGYKFKITLEKHFEWKTSDWVLQELGYCLGKGMKSIILLEKGVRKISGLHADLEYIVFDRNNVAQCFEKLLQQISTLSTDSPAASDNDASGTNENESGEGGNEENQKSLPLFSKEIEDYSKPRNGWTDKTYWIALYIAVEEENHTKENEIFTAGKSFFNTAEDLATWNAQYLFIKGELRQETVKEQIESISKDHPQCSKIKIILARIYSKFGSKDKAEEIALEAAAIENSFMSQSFTYALDCIKSNQGEVEAIKQLLIHQSGFICNDDSLNIIFLTTYANLVKKIDIQLYFAILEATLSLKPDDKTLRFDLAFAYSENSLQNFAAHHYEILLQLNPNSHAYLNNLAVAYAKLGLSIESIKYYKKAAELKHTIAMSNLANRYISNGFLEEAQQLCSDALKEKDFDKSVLASIESNNQKVEAEKTILDSITENIKDHKSFYTSFGLNLNADKSSLPAGTFRVPNRVIDIYINGNEFNATSTIEKAVTTGTGLLSSLTIQEPLTMSIKGLITGRTIKALIDKSLPNQNKIEALIYFDIKTGNYTIAEFTDNNKINKLYTIYKS